jgi:hypothetical protein
MITWISSYPRSGNTLVRSILRNAFELSSYSAYDDVADIGADPRVAAHVGHVFLGAPWEQAYERLKPADEMAFVKTHEVPVDDAKAIYVVRDGRSACRSYFHYLRDFFQRSRESTYTPGDVIAGFTPALSWTDHLNAWNPLERPNTLMLRFEQLLADPAGQIARIAAFIEREPSSAWQNNFEEMKQHDPRFFRAGAASDPTTALEPADLEIFWAFHGQWMLRLGYAPPEVTLPPAVPPALRTLIARRALVVVQHA